jgi:putative spermidine/putrescine transport system substrate-binding protein
VHACGVGAIIYNLVLAYDGDKMKAAPSGWADFFDSKKCRASAPSATAPSGTWRSR